MQKNKRDLMKSQKRGSNLAVCIVSLDESSIHDLITTLMSDQKDAEMSDVVAHWISADREENACADDSDLYVSQSFRIQKYGNLITFYAQKERPNLWNVVDACLVCDFVIYSFSSPTLSPSGVELLSALRGLGHPKSIILSNHSADWTPVEKKNALQLVQAYTADCAKAFNANAEV